MTPTTMMRLIGLIFVVSLAAAAPAGAQTWTLVWNDEFDGAALAPERWSFQTGDGCPNLCDWGNNELEFYRAENASVEDGRLVITAKEETFGGRAYTSARLRTLGRAAWRYGRFEMRAKLPTGQGLWAAFWMLPVEDAYGSWAASGEIDIMEHVGHEPATVHGTIHHGGEFPQNIQTGAPYTLDAGTFADEFHTFAVEWEPGELRWYVDDVLYQTLTDWTTSSDAPFPAPFDRDFYLLLNLAVGGFWPGPPDATTVFPQTYEIDYVRVYHDAETTPTVALGTGTPDHTFAPGASIPLTADATDPDGEVERALFYVGDALLADVDAPPFTTTWTDVQPGCYDVRVRVEDNDGRVAETEAVRVTVGEGCPQAPYRGAAAPIPGRIEAENYDLGGAGTAYRDQDATNNGNPGGNTYRMDEGVDIEATTDTGGGFNVGWIEPREWLAYTVDVAESGLYAVEARAASENAGGRFRLLFDGEDRSGEISVPPTGGWQNWTTVRADSLQLDAGIQTMRIDFRSSGFNLNHLTFIPLSATPIADEGEAPGRDPVLHAPYPNPFTDRARIRYELARPGQATVTLHDVYGRRVALLADGFHAPGRHEAALRADTLPSGVYFVRLIASETRQTRRLTVAK